MCQSLQPHVPELATACPRLQACMPRLSAYAPYAPFSSWQSPHFAARVTEEYVYIAETDHLMLRPLPNLATRHVPAGFDFGYMVAWGQASVVDKFVPGLGGKTDPVGPSPVMIHVEQLKQVGWVRVRVRARLG